MNYAVIIAGGSGNRMGQDIPKQFMHAMVRSPFTTASTDCAKPVVRTMTWY